MTDLRGHNIIYVTRDIERAIGLDISTPGFYIISNATEFAKVVGFEDTNIELVESDELLDTWQLLEHESTKQFLSTIENPEIVVFKNTPKIERICAEHNWKLLNPSAALANTIEEKISQVEWLGELTSLLPPHEIKTLKEVTWNDEPFILQFNRAHTGSGTIFVESETQLQKLSEKFPERPVRITKYIEGPMFTSNNVVSIDAVLPGNISYQITGLAPFTSLPFATVGNDFGTAHSLLSDEQKEAFENIVNAVGDKLQKDGWRGLFGVDVILDMQTGKLFLIEINARQPASTSFESWLQPEYKIMEAHVQALIETPLSDYSLDTVKEGAQIILRNKEKGIRKKEELQRKLEDLKLRVISYENTKPESDALRIQSHESIMKAHGILTDHGIEIQSLCQ